ncbi:MAG: hypothetical protein ACRDRA_08960 [Pseudonocardiaceae bacterium]
MSELGSPKRQREHLVRALRAEGRSWVDIAEVLRQRYRVNARIAFRWAHNWSQRQAADEWNKRWPDELKTFKYFSYWEQWPGSTGHGPSYDNLSKLAQLYECAVSDLLVDLPDFRHLDSASAAGNATAARQSGTPVVIPDTSLAPAEAAQPQFLDDAQVLVPRVVRALEVTRHAAVSELAALEDLDTVVEHYKQTFRNTPPSELYDEILRVRIHAGSLLDGTRAANNHSDLVVAAGWLSNLLALLTHDLHDRAASLVWCADAERYSREARYPELGGWAAQTRVLMSFYDGQAREAVTHAQRGQQLAPLGTVVHAKLVAQEMRAWALIGNSDKVSSTRWRAEKAIAKLPPGTPTRGAFSISLADDPPYTATSLLLLGRYREAEEATRRVIATFYGSGTDEGRREHPSGFARTHLILALALAGLGKLDEAYAAGSVALEAPRLVWPVAVLAGKLDRTLTRDFTATAEACSYHEQYVAAMQQNPSVSGQPTHLDTPSS